MSKTPDPLKNQPSAEARRNTAAAIKLYAEGELEAMTLMLANTDPLVSRASLIAWLCLYAELAEVDPADLYKHIALRAEQDLLAQQQEEEEASDDE